MSVPSQFKITQSNTIPTKTSQDTTFKQPIVSSSRIKSVTNSIKSSPKESKIKDNEHLPSELVQFCKIFPAIPGQAFRQFILPNDNALAEIMDCDLPEIKANLERIKKGNSSLKRIRSLSPQQMPTRSADSGINIDWNSSLVERKRVDKYQGTASKGTVRVPWSKEEEDNLIAGYKRFGNNWVKILQHYKFNNRTNVNLKDKVRNLQKKGILVISQDS